METQQLAFRSSASFGKRMEYVVGAELLKRYFDVYTTLMDAHQIDSILYKKTDDHA